MHFGTWYQVVPVIHLDRRVWNIHRGEAAKIVICCPCQQGVTYIEHVLKAGDLTSSTYLIVIVHVIISAFKLRIH